jgi:hypothetical protein
VLNYQADHRRQQQANGRRGEFEQQSGAFR